MWKGINTEIRYSRENCRMRLSLGFLLRFRQRVTEWDNSGTCDAQLRFSLSGRGSVSCWPILWGVYRLFRTSHRNLGVPVRIRRRPFVIHLAIDYNTVVRSCIYWHWHFRSDESTWPDSSRAVPAAGPVGRLFHGWSTHARPRNGVRVRDQWNRATFRWFTQWSSFAVPGCLQRRFNGLIDLRRTKWRECQSSQRGRKSGYHERWFRFSGSTERATHWTRWK